MPKEYTDEEIEMSLRHAAEVIGIEYAYYTHWLSLDPEGAADEYAEAVRLGPNPERVFLKFWALIEAQDDA